MVFETAAASKPPTLSLHDALPISPTSVVRRRGEGAVAVAQQDRDVIGIDVRDGEITLSVAIEVADSNRRRTSPDRKSTRLNSSHRCISYAVFCLKKKNNINEMKKT